MIKNRESSLVLLDARSMAGRSTGMGRYVSQMLSELPALASNDIKFKVISLPGDQVPDGISNHVLGGFLSCLRPGKLAQHAIIPWVVDSSKCDLYHYPYFDPPVPLRKRFVATCPDLEPLRMPNLFSRKVVAYYEVFAVRLRHAARVITISENTKKDVVELLGINPNVVRVIYLGVDKRFRPVLEEEELTNIYHLPNRYVLYVGNTMPHKNLQRLVQAMARVCRLCPDVKLVIVGALDRYRSNVEQIIQNTGMNLYVRFLDFVSENDLPALYSKASAFILPSLYEGFGLPILEAMACGAPVIASNAASIPEIVGDAGIIVDPYNIEEISDGILRLLNNQSEAKNYSNLGIERAQQFTWRHCAEEHLKVYREVLG